MLIQNTCPATWVNSSIVPHQSPFQAHQMSPLDRVVMGISRENLRLRAAITGSAFSAFPTAARPVSVKGTYKWSNGPSYEGDFEKAGRPVSVKGTYKWSNGLSYEGDFEKSDYRENNLATYYLPFFSVSIIFALALWANIVAEDTPVVVSVILSTI